MTSFNLTQRLFAAILLCLMCFSASAMKCDVDQDLDIDRIDISEIFKARGQVADGADDPRDGDNNLVIDIRDGRVCQLQCTLERCAEPPPPASHSGYVIQIKVQDTDTSAISINQPISLGFVGPELVDENIQPVTNLTVDNLFSLATLYLKDEPQQGQDIKITASAPGFFDTGTSVLLSPDQELYQIDIKLIKSESGQIAPGIQVSSTAIDKQVEDGVLNSEVVATNQAPPGAPTVRVTLPSGVVMTDIEGVEVNGARLNIASFDPYFPEALEAYPGGLDVIADATGFVVDNVEQVGETEINFKSAGFVAINIEDENGKKVKNFSENIEVAMQFRLGTKDASGNFVLVGDEVPLWSYDENTGVWTYEKMGVVQDLNFFDGMFDVVFSIDHLTYFNLDWYLSDRCTSAEFVILDPDGVPLSSEQMGDLQAQLSINSAPEITRWMYFNADTENVIHFINAPRGFPGSLTFYDKSRITEMGRVEFADICADHQSSYDVNVDSLSNLNFEKAMEIIDDLLSRPLPFKQQGLTPISPQIRLLSQLATSLLANGDPDGETLVAEIANLVIVYAEAFLDNVDNLYEQRLLAQLPFIDGGVATGSLTGYGCLHPQVTDLVREILSTYATYVQFGGSGNYAIGDLSLQFIERAAREFISFTPDGLAYTGEGVSGFVRCGFELFAELQTLGYDGGTLDSDILDHFEPVVLANVLKMREDVDFELNLGIGDLPPTGKITLSTAETFDFILQDALAVATDLATIGWFSSQGINQINEQIAYLQELRDTGKVDLFIPQ